MRVAITGSSRGIGLAIAQLLRKRGLEVIDLSRAVIELAYLDVDSISLQGIDILINNAATDTTPTAYSDLDYDAIIHMITVNLIAPMLLTHKFIRENERGVIINVTSSCVNRPHFVGNSTYQTTKKALAAFTDTIREEVKDRDFRVVEIVPGRTATDMTVGKPNAVQPKDIAAAVLFSIENEYIENITIKHPKR